MRTNIDLDEALIAEAMALTGLSTKKATVEEALRRLIRSARQNRAIENMHDMGWEGDLDALRRTRSE
jgi:Arc/MetJ family transcription regulator